MKILITGSNGFIGKNLIEQFKNIQSSKLKHPLIEANVVFFEYDLDSEPSLLEQYCKECNFVIHLAGVNRPKEVSEFMEGNFGFTSTLLNLLKKYNNYCPIILASSTQAELENPYGESKRAGEKIIREHFLQQSPNNQNLITNHQALIYRFPNVFGKWCRPNYNSGVATFCHNIANNLPIQVNDPKVVMNLVYIDDVIDELLNAVGGNPNRKDDLCYVPVVHAITLGEIVDLIYSFKSTRDDKSVPNLGDPFIKKLYSTYLSYLPSDQFSYPLKMNIDNRGSFTEIIKTSDRGQFSVNISKPGITKGQHWHHTKTEKFIVVSGKGLIQLRRVGVDQEGNKYPIINYHVSGEKIEVVDMIPGYTHNIINLSETDDLVTLMWCNEIFDPEKPDTFFEVV